MCEWVTNPPSLEESDPELDSLLKWFCNIPRKKIIKVKIGRNDPCPFCKNFGKNIKWKKCKKHNPGV